MEHVKGSLSNLLIKLQTSPLCLQMTPFYSEGWNLSFVPHFTKQKYFFPIIQIIEFFRGEQRAQIFKLLYMDYYTVPVYRVATGLNEWMYQFKKKNIEAAYFFILICSFFRLGLGL